MNDQLHPPMDVAFFQGKVRQDTLSPVVSYDAQDMPTTDTFDAEQTAILEGLLQSKDLHSLLQALTDPRKKNGLSSVLQQDLARDGVQAKISSMVEELCRRVRSKLNTEFPVSGRATTQQETNSFWLSVETNDRVTVCMSILTELANNQAFGFDTGNLNQMIASLAGLKSNVMDRWNMTADGNKRTQW